MALRCASCGGQTPDGSEFCQNCGYSITGKIRPTQRQVQEKSGMSVGTIVIIVIVVLVIVPVVLSAVLYFMVLGFGSTSSQTPVSFLTKTTVTYGVKMTFGPVSTEMQWSDVTILLNDGSITQSWAPATADLDTGTVATCAYVEKSLGILTVYLNVTDLTGNGHVNAGDFFTLTTPSVGTFNTATTYTVTIMHDPTGAAICHAYFTGQA